MKKSVLAVAIAAAAFAASAASAAQVYDKDGTTLAVGGQVEFMAGNAGNSYFNNDDATTRDRARLTMAGRTQLTNGIYAYAYNEWQADHNGNNSADDASLKARQQFLGVDFGNFGKVQMGRYKDPFVFASAVVDVLDEVGIYGGNDERNSGHLSYMWKGFGFDAGVSYQFAVDGYNTDTLGLANTGINALNTYYKSQNFIDDLDGTGITSATVEIDNIGKFNVESGFSVYAGYTSVPVVFGPISIRAAYQYLKGQGNSETNTPSAVIDNLKTYDVSLAWGTNGKGFYVATNYNYSKASLDETYIKVTATTVAGTVSDKVELDAIKTKAWETVATYGFENGIRLGASYHWINVDLDDVDGDRKFVQLIADYNVTPNFKVWAETIFDAGSDDGLARHGSLVLDADNRVDALEHNSFMVGARYVF